MTETREELLEQGWKRQCPHEYDLDIVSQTACNNKDCRGAQILETWIKPGQPNKQFTYCWTCEHRQPFARSSNATGAVQVVEYTHPGFQLIHGHCTHEHCDNWATRYLLNEHGKRVPGTRLCRYCAGEIIREYRAKLQLAWQAHPIIMYHVNHRLFTNRDHAQTYADRNAEGAA